MKKFLAIYTGTAARRAEWQSMSEERRKQAEQSGIAAWKQWATTNAASIVDGGAPLGKTKRTSAQGISDTKNEIGAYTIVQAESHDAAAKMFLDHPHFTIFPGDAVEIMECLPLP